MFFLVYLCDSNLMDKPSFKIRLFHLWFRLVRPVTLGVRIFVQNEKKELLLVRHTYIDGWHLPGGGVEAGQTTHQAAKIELLEETGIELGEAPELITIYANRKASRRDHVLLYRAKDWERVEEFKANSEIAEIGFFPLDALPEQTTTPVKSRIQELIYKKALSAYW